jgi:hypothetical protein
VCSSDLRLRERSTCDPVTGRSWPRQAGFWLWHGSPVEAQALLIEVMEDVLRDPATAMECRQWLLFGQQRSHWGSTKATAEALYALMRGPVDLLASAAPLGVTAGGEPLPVPAPADLAEGGPVEYRLEAGQIRPSQGRVAFTRQGEGFAVGAVHWQYFEEEDRLPPHGDGLDIDKRYAVREPGGDAFLPLPPGQPLHVGDLVRVTLTLRSDRPLEYVHVKDGRAVGLEPVDALSGYRGEGGVRFYQMTRDTSTHFFLDRVSQGEWEWTFDLRVQHRGTFMGGRAEAVCMYSPEFNARSPSRRLEVR